MPSNLHSSIFFLHSSLSSFFQLFSSVPKALITVKISTLRPETSFSSLYKEYYLPGPKLDKAYLIKFSYSLCFFFSTFPLCYDLACRKFRLVEFIFLLSQYRPFQSCFCCYRVFLIRPLNFFSCLKNITADEISEQLGTDHLRFFRLKILFTWV